MTKRSIAFELPVPGAAPSRHHSYESTDAFLAMLERLRVATPVVAQARMADGGGLTIGLSDHLRFLQFAPRDPHPPYLVAVARSPATTEPMSFDAHGTPTPIEPRYLLSSPDFEAAIRDALAGTLEYPWEEV